MTDAERQLAYQLIDNVIARLASLNLTYDTGQRRDGEIVWKCVPGREAEMEAFLAQLESQPHAQRAVATRSKRQ